MTKYVLSIIIFFSFDHVIQSMEKEIAPVKEEFQKMRELLKKKLQRKKYQPKKEKSITPEIVQLIEIMITRAMAQIDEKIIAIKEEEQFQRDFKAWAEEWDEYTASFRSKNLLS